jgi:hypothetical protein
MDQDKEFLRAMIERRQQMLAKMSEQLKRASGHRPAGQQPDFGA